MKKHFVVTLISALAIAFTPNIQTLACEDCEPWKCEVVAVASEPSNSQSTTWQSEASARECDSSGSEMIRETFADSSSNDVSSIPGSDYVTLPTASDNDSTAKTTKTASWSRKQSALNATNFTVLEVSCVSRHHQSSAKRKVFAAVQTVR